MLHLAGAQLGPETTLTSFWQCKLDPDYKNTWIECSKAMSRPLHTPKHLPKVVERDMVSSLLWIHKTFEQVWQTPLLLLAPLQE